MKLLLLTFCFMSLCFAANFPSSEQESVRDTMMQEMMGRLNNLEERVQRCETGLQKISTSKPNGMKRLLGGVQNTTSDSTRVSFYAHLSKNVAGIGVHHTIVFDTLRYNDGNAYNKFDGIFTAKIPGTYFFIWTISASDRNTMETELVVNGEVFGHVIGDAANHIDWAVATGFVIVRLSVNDTVWIRSGPVNTGHLTGSGYGTSSFGGYLLYK